MMRKILFVSLSLLSVAFGIRAQTNDLPLVGQWRDHLPYNEAVQVVETENKIFCATRYALFSYHKNDHNIEKLSRVHGLTEANISAIAYAEQTGYLIVAYENANIDLIKDYRITNIPEIKNKTNLLNKVIHNISIHDNIAYFACGFGIVEYDLSRLEFGDTYFLGEAGTQAPIFDVDLDDNFIYAATNTGVLMADASNPNLVNFNNWSFIPGLPSAKYSAMEYFADRLFVILDSENQNEDRLLYLEEGEWKEQWPDFNTEFYSLNALNGYLNIARKSWTTTFNAGLYSVFNVRVDDPVHALYTRNNILYVADSKDGLVRFESDDAAEIILPRGPAVLNVFDLEYHAGAIYAVAGGYNQQYTQTYTRADLSRFSNGEWTTETTDSLRDLIRIVGAPNDADHIYTASWGYGVIEFQDMMPVDQYTSANSPIESTIPESNVFHRTQGMVFDDEKNLWITVTGTTVENSLVVKTPDDEWYAYDLRGAMEGAAYAGDIIITPSGHKWITLPRGNGLFVFDDNGTLAETSDDQYRHFDLTDDEDQQLSNDVYSIVQDHDNNIWVGTANGPVVYYNPNNVFEEEGFYGTQIRIPQNDTSNFASILLENQIVTSIQIDGANRKWFGTRGSGAFLIAEDGREEIMRFSAENSPLPSNNVIDIAIHEETGEIFFATDKGIFSYRGVATQGNDVFSEVYAFPNPVRPGYQGDIIITGLIENTNVKITDISGNLAYETTSLGGQAQWDGRTLSGKRVQTGVYLIFCSTPDGSQTHVAKLLFIN